MIPSYFKIEILVKGATSVLLGVKGLKCCRERSKVGSSLADVEPMAIDRSVTFSAVGGLGPHIRSLREMVVLPLLYPEIFSRFNVSPPRGVLFFGPPGKLQRASIAYFI